MDYSWWLCNADEGEALKTTLFFFSLAIKVLKDNRHANLPGLCTTTTTSVVDRKNQNTKRTPTGAA